MISTFLLGMFCVTATSGASSYTLSDNQLVVTTSDNTSTTLTLPCTPKEAVQQGERVYLACGDAGLLVVAVDAPPRLLGALDLGGSVEGIHVRRGTIWVEITKAEAHPLGALVTSRLEFQTDTSTEVPHAGSTTTNTIPEFNQWAPPRHSEMWSATFTLRPFLALGAFGFGTVSDASVGYRMAKSVHLLAVLEPLGVGFAKEGNIVSTAGNAIVSYDRQLFEIGLGAGWSAVNNELSRGDRDALSNGEGGGLTAHFTNVHYSLSIAQLARLGSEDGLQLTVRNTFILYDDAFHYGGTVGQALVPLDGRTWLVARGGGGAAGFGYGEIGLRMLVLGEGHHGSLLLTASLGGAGVFGEVSASQSKCDPASFTANHYLGSDNKCYKSVSYGGPMVGLGVEWRP